MYVYIRYVCICMIVTCMNACKIRLYVFKEVYIYIFVLLIYMYVCMYVCMYVYAILLWATFILLSTSSKDNEI